MRITLKVKHDLYVLGFLFLVLLGAISYRYYEFNRIKLLLSTEDNNLRWEFSEALSPKNYSFNVFHNNEEIATTGDFVLEDFPLTDKTNPTQPQNITLDYDRDGVKVSWDKSEDETEINTYMIKMTNEKGKNIKKSNIVEVEWASGLKEYHLTLNDNEMTTTETNYYIDEELLLEGENTLTVKAIDYAGNHSENNIKILFSKLETTIEDKTLKLNISDMSQEYDYKLIVEDSEVEGNISDAYDIRELFVDDVAPSEVKVSHTLNNNKATFTWSANDMGHEYSYEVIGTGSLYENKVFSDNETYTALSGMKGYYYYFGEDANYGVTTEDTFTESGKFEKEDLEYKTYYLKVRAIDNAGNLSETTSYKLTNSAPKPADYKMEQIKNLFVKTGVSEQVINQYAKYIYDYMPQYILNAVANDGVKIHIIDENVRRYVINNYGIDAGLEMKGCFVNDPHNQVIVSSSGGMHTLLHEFGHAYDFSKSYSDYYSNTSEFLDIYRAESANMFGANNYFASNEMEYYAESLYTYLTNRASLKQKAPRTHDYFNQLLGY